MRIAYRCKIDKQEDGKFLVTFPDFDEAVTEGESLEEAVFNAEEVLTLTLDGRMVEGIDIPLPSLDKPCLGYFLVYPSPRIQSALLVRFSRSGKSLSELARSLETSWPSASRLEDPHHWSSLRQLSKAAEVFGHRLVLSFEPAPPQSRNTLSNFLSDNLV